MTISYENIVEKLLIEARDLMRADTSLVTLLGGTTVNSKNFIFSGRPTDQRKGFNNPRIICEAPSHNPDRAGGNPDGYHDDEITFMISGWINEQPIATPLNVMERIRVLFDEKNFSTEDGSVGTFRVTNTALDPDAEKLATMQCRVLINATVKYKDV